MRRPFRFRAKMAFRFWYFPSAMSGALAQVLLGRGRATIIEEK